MASSRTGSRQSQCVADVRDADDDYVKRNLSYSWCLSGGRPTGSCRLHLGLHETTSPSRVCLVRALR
jgi:hypothetical protein